MLDEEHLRRSERLPYVVPIIITGNDALGCPFTETSRTIVISKHGGLIATSHRLEKGSRIQLENPALSRMATGKVVWVRDGRTHGAPFHVGVEVEGAAYLWPVEFFRLGLSPAENGEPAGVHAVVGRAA